MPNEVKPKGPTISKPLQSNRSAAYFGIALVLMSLVDNVIKETTAACDTPGWSLALYSIQWTQWICLFIASASFSVGLFDLHCTSGMSLYVSCCRLWSCHVSIR